MHADSRSGGLGATTWASALMVCTAAAVSLGQAYTITAINPEGVPLSTSVGGSEVDGLLVGHDMIPGREPPFRAFLWEGGELAWLDGPPGLGLFVPGRARSREVIPGSVGSSETGYRAALLSHGVWSFADPLPGWRDAGAWIVLDNGDWVGVSRYLEGPGDILTAATLWRDGEPVALAPTDSTSGTTVHDASDDGRILGSTWSIAGDPAQYWVWTDGERQPVENPTGFAWERPLGFDPGGGIRGLAWAEDGSLQMVRARADGVDVIAVVPDEYRHYLTVTDFDTGGRFVGFSYDQWSHPIPLLWDGTEFIDLRNQFDSGSGWDIGNPVYLDDSGRIAGLGWSGEGDAYRAFLLTPVPGPSGLVAMGMAAALVGVRRRR